MKLQIRDVITNQVNYVNPAQDPVAPLKEQQDMLTSVVEDMILNDTAIQLQEQIEALSLVIEELILGGML